MTYRSGPAVVHAGRLVLRPWWRPLTVAPLVLVGLLASILLLVVPTTHATLHLHPPPPPPPAKTAVVLLVVTQALQARAPRAHFELEWGGALGGSSASGDLGAGLDDLTRASVSQCGVKLSGNLTETIGWETGLGCDRDVAEKARLEAQIEAWLRAPHGDLVLG